jgi:tRNA threonylcarbamoyladenosine modification (KEOPS) complex  Pcc1 subunit
MASGLGTPNGSGLVATLCADSIGVTNPGAQRSVVRSPVSLQIQALDTRGATMTYSAAGLPAGLSINPSSGKITGHPRHIGSSTVTVTASNRAGTTGQTAFMWAIQGNPTLSHVSLSGGGHPRLKFMVAAGRDAPLLSTIAVALPRGLRFTRSRATVNIRGRGRRRVRFTMSLRHGRLVLKLRRASDQLHVTISYPRLQSTGRRRSGRVTLTVRATDAAALQTKLTARMRT